VYFVIPDGGAVAGFESNVPITSELVNRSGTFTTYRIQLHANHGAAWLRAPSHERALAAEYTLGMQPANTSLVTGLRHVESRRKCSSTEMIALDIVGTAVAYRVDWHDGSTTFMDAPRLGFIGCGAYNAVLSELQGFDLVALYADGSEQRLGTSCAMIDHDRIRLPTELVGHIGRIEPKPQLELEWSEEDEPTSRFGWLVAHAGLLALVFAIHQLASLIRPHAIRK
jgi:hypothetical protein